MPVYTYKARTVGGETQSGEMTASTEADVVGLLRRRRLVVTQVKEKPKDIKLSFGRGIKTKDLVVFTRQFATMINAGLPLVQSLDILATQQTKPKVAEKIRAMLNDV